MSAISESGSRRRCCSMNSMQALYSDGRRYLVARHITSTMQLTQSEAGSASASVQRKAIIARNAGYEASEISISSRARSRTGVDPSDSTSCSSSSSSPSPPAPPSSSSSPPSTWSPLPSPSSPESRVLASRTPSPSPSPSPSVLATESRVRRARLPERPPDRDAGRLLRAWGVRPDGVREPEPRSEGDARGVSDSRMPPKNIDRK
mmetsp:Transcript_5505/g.19719  ORF Transcript_5505/g.19719 Transcript_5505/m.19719 type:complete len:205 (-) Transcript_5505:1132-1746(-)